MRFSNLNFLLFSNYFNCLNVSEPFITQRQVNDTRPVAGRGETDMLSIHQEAVRGRCFAEQDDAKKLTTVFWWILQNSLLFRRQWLYDLGLETFSMAKSNIHHEKRNEAYELVSSIHGENSNVAFNLFHQAENSCSQNIRLQASFQIPQLNSQSRCAFTFSVF